MVQLRSMGPGLWADRWLFEQAPELRGLQAAVLQSQVQQNVPCLNAEVDKMSPADGGEGQSGDERGLCLPDRRAGRGSRRWRSRTRRQGLRRWPGS